MQKLFSRGLNSLSNSELQSRVLSLQEAIRKLSELSKVSKKKFLSEYTISDTILHTLQITIEVITDIGNYILKRKGHKIPETRVEVFEFLCNHGYLPLGQKDDL
jgi:uncharacterized protein YutE (UPF0331/DUF86 family)